MQAAHGEDSNRVEAFRAVLIRERRDRLRWELVVLDEGVVQHGVHAYLARVSYSTGREFIMYVRVF